MRRRAAARPSTWAGIDDPAQVAFLERLHRALDAKLPGAVVASVDREKGWGSLVLAGKGKRRLAGMRRDLREHVLRAAYDGRWLQASFEVAGERVDTLSLPAPKADDVRTVVDFFVRRAPRIWWAPPEGAAEPVPPAPRPAKGAAKASSPRRRRRD